MLLYSRHLRIVRRASWKWQTLQSKAPNLRSLNSNQDPAMPGIKGGVTTQAEAAELGYFLTHRRKKSEATDCGGVAEYHACTYYMTLYIYI